MILERPCTRRSSRIADVSEPMSMHRMAFSIEIWCRLMAIMIAESGVSFS